MTIYERIKKRRKELGLTADQVADSLGISRATVYRYESSDIEKIPFDIIEPLSEVLQCSPAYIMGWDSPAPSTKTTTDTQELLDTYNKLNGEGKQKVREYASDLVNTGMYEKKVAL
jgi:transcriptional regulator with XRE-family HTH domain